MKPGSQNEYVKSRFNSATSSHQRHKAASGSPRANRPTTRRERRSGATRRATVPTSRPTTGRAKYQLTSVPKLQVCSIPGRNPVDDVVFVRVRVLIHPSIPSG